MIALTVAMAVMIAAYIALCAGHDRAGRCLTAAALALFLVCGTGMMV